MITIYDDKADCCGCGACSNVCPKQAISMELDENGFIYPYIDDKLCMECGACKRVCAFQNENEENTLKSVFAAARKNNDKVKQSASGGIFGAFAEQILRKGGVVFGSAMIYEEGKLIVKHKEVDNINDLSILLGSKYVQSSIINIFPDVKQRLLEGKYVLFSGTPCQVASIKSYLKKDYENLLTVDIICHGVPSEKFFQDYISTLSLKIKEKIIDFKFRDKTNGWGLNAKAIYKDSDGKIKNRRIACNESSYYDMFLKSEIYRENCYSCPYANRKRIGDITIGDYWGIEREHPELLVDNGGFLDVKKGVSVIIINSKSGERWFNKLCEELNYYPSEYEKAAKVNTQLREPSSYSINRDKILRLYRTKGYSSVENYFLLRRYRMKIIRKVGKFIPKRIKKSIKKVVGK